jgi:hypothetical protein
MSQALHRTTRPTRSWTQGPCRRRPDTGPLHPGRGNRRSRSPFRGIVAALLAVALTVGLVQVIVVPSSHGANGPALAPTATTAAVAAGSTGGEWQTTAVGTVSASGGAVSFGSIATSVDAPIIGMASTPDGRGYWLAGSDGSVFAFGDATYFGGLANRTLRRPIVGIEATPDGQGYWLVGAHGAVSRFGDAGYYGSTPRRGLSAPIVALQTTPDGQGYWLVAADGGVFSFGDATFYGSMAGEALTAPVVGMAATSDGSGYWLVAADGGVFNFGDAPFYGSGVGEGVGNTIVGIIPGVDGQSYSLIGNNGVSYPIREAPAPPTTSTSSTNTSTSTSTPSSSTPSPPSAAVTLTPMRGAGLVDLPTDCGDTQTLGLSWYYNWESSTNCPNVGVPFVPMEFGDWCSGSSSCSALPTSLAANGNQYLLTFNEPDNPSQSNMSVARAVQLWPYLEATGLQLSSPAVTSGSSGATWLASFMSQASQLGLRVNFLALHWYGDCSNPQNLINYLAGMETSYGLPEWLTEFSCINDSAAVNANFIQQVAPELTALPYLQRFAWFTNRPYPNGYQNTNLLDTNGALTPVGQAYTAIPAG